MDANYLMSTDVMDRAQDKGQKNVLPLTNLIAGSANANQQLLVVIQRLSYNRSSIFSKKTRKSWYS